MNERMRREKCGEIFPGERISYAASARREYISTHTTRGQAVMELIIVLPFLVFIILFGLQIFKAIYEAQIKQETAKVRLLSEKIQNRANGGIDMPSSEVVQETSSSIDTAGIPILTEEGVTPPISIKIGICRDINCGEGI